MLVSLGICKNDKRQLQKSVDWKYKEFNVVFKTENNVINPKIVIRNSDGKLKCNYCYIPHLNRYYWISNISTANGDFLILDLTVDVLMTYRNEIKNSYGFIERNEVDYNNYLIDNEVVVSNKKIRTTKSIGNVGSGYYYYITCNGISAT